MSLLYFTSEYPAFSHTFILREIQALRADGFIVHTAAIRRPADIAAMTDEDKEEYARTAYLRDDLLRRGIAIYAGQCLRMPLAALGMLARAVRWFALNGPRRPIKALAYLLEASLLLHLMRRRGLRHVHTHFGNAAANAAMLAAGTGLVEFSISAHGPDIFFDVQENLLPLKARRAAFVRCISHFCASQFMRILPPALWDKLHIVRCGVDPARFAPAARHSPLRGSAESMRLLCLGRICPAKAQPLLLRAAARLLAEGRSLHLTFAGGGDIDALQKEAAALGVAAHVTFTGAVDADTARALYDQADIFVLPSVAEGVPVALMEAMSKQLPCVATSIAGIPELITHGCNGLLATPGDIESLTDSLRRLMTDASLRSRLGEAGRTTVLKSYDLTRNGAAMSRLLRERLNARLGPSTAPENPL